MSLMDDGPAKRTRSSSQKKVRHLINYWTTRMNILVETRLEARQTKMYVCTLEELYSSSISCMSVQHLEVKMN